MFKRLFSARRWLALCGLITVLLLAVLALLSPQQLPVILYKAALRLCRVRRRLARPSRVPLCPSVRLLEDRLAATS